MHPYQQFIQDQLDARGWRQSDLARRSGLSRQLISQTLSDTRPHLGRMPDSGTIEKLATGFEVSIETVRTAAARSLVDYSDDGTPLTIGLEQIPTEALLAEIGRRIEAAQK